MCFNFITAHFLRLWDHRNPPTISSPSHILLLPFSGNTTFYLACTSHASFKSLTSLNLPKMYYFTTFHEVKPSNSCVTLINLPILFCVTLINFPIQNCSENYNSKTLYRLQLTPIRSLNISPSSRESA